MANIFRVKRLIINGQTVVTILHPKDTNYCEFALKECGCFINYIPLYSHQL